MNAPQGDSPVLRPGSAGKQFLFQIVLTVGLFLSIAFVPLAGFFSSMLTPVPVALALIRWGYPNGWLVPGCSAVLGSLVLYLLDLSECIPYLLGLIGLGALMGYGLRRRWSTEKVIGLSSLFMIALAGVFFILAFIQTKGEVVQLTKQVLGEAISATMKQLGNGSLEARQMEGKLLEAVPMIVRIMPGMLTSCTLAMCWINLLVSRRFCRTDAFDCVSEKLVLWKSPEFIVWFVIASGLMVLLPVSGLRLLGINVLIVLGTVYFLQGLAIAAFYFEKWKLPFFVRGFVYALLFLLKFASMATAALGLFDVWFDFRKLSKKSA
jgi:uncharacterized protein YybS (DUF2232 family)